MGKLVSLEILTTKPPSSISGGSSQKEYGHKKALEFIEAIDNSATIVKVGRNDIMNSMLLNFNDLEDSLVSYCAEREKADYIVTRNGKDFLESRIEALSPEEFFKKTKIR